MTQFDDAKAVAAFMNDNPDASLDIWNAFAAQHGMVPFDYSDDDWYRNDEYVVSHVFDRYKVFNIDGYDVEKKTVWRAMVKGEPVSEWVDSLSEALECAMNHIHSLEQQSPVVDDPDISFQKKRVIK